MFEKGHEKIGGRQKGSGKSEEFKRLVKEKSVEALKVVEEIMNNVNAEDSARLRAAQIIIEHAVGKPVQRLGNENEGEQLQILVKTVNENGIDKRDSTTGDKG